MTGNRADASVAERFLTSFAARDWEALHALFAPDLIWTMPGHGTISGTVHGADAAVERARKIAGRGLHTELGHVLTGRNGVALTLHNTAEDADGRTLDEHLATVLTLRDGQVSAIDSYVSDVDGMSAFFN
ncbi:nuclear transport factor 2 family protein [Streptomyces sp. NPDC058961]|uniref:nuclear transport factor 2 family protein n=1 Tax=unclassified Streptomyces TaxID=2593676 RepID=UPI0035DA4077